MSVEITLHTGKPLVTEKSFHTRSIEGDEPSPIQG